jgi:hypothetical protein
VRANESSQAIASLSTDRVRSPWVGQILNIFRRDRAKVEEPHNRLRGANHEAIPIETQLGVVVGGGRCRVPRGNPIRRVPGGSSQANDRWRIASGHIRHHHARLRTLSRFLFPCYY